MIPPRLLLAAALALLTAAPAFAQPRGHDDHGRGPDHGSDHGRMQARPHEFERQRQRERHRYDDYYRRPDIYYSAPPVIYPPPVYYQQPGASLNFSFPFYAR